MLWVASANWVAAIGSTTIATFCLPITLVAAILPAILAVPYLNVRMLRRVSDVSLCVSAVTVGLGTLQDFSSLTNELEGAQPWLPSAILLAFLPFISGLENVAKHAGDEARPRLKLARTEEGLVFEVADAGNGFDPASVGGRGHGLTNMADRIGSVGGKLTWSSTPGCGVRVQGTVPADVANPG